MKAKSLVDKSIVEFDKNKFDYYKKKFDDNISYILKLMSGIKVDSIMEIGCSYGQNLALLLKHKKFRRVIGVDISRKWIEKYPLYAGKFEFIEMDVEKKRIINLPQVDMVLMIDVLEHLKDPSLFLKRLKIKYCIIKLPLESGLIKSILMSLGLASRPGKEHKSGHLRGYTLKEGLNLCKSSDLNIVKYFYTFNPLWLNYPSLYLNKKGTYKFYLTKIFVFFDGLCRKCLPKRVYLMLFGGVLCVLCKRQ